MADVDKIKNLKNHFSKMYEQMYWPFCTELDVNSHNESSNQYQKKTETGWAEKLKVWQLAILLVTKLQFVTIRNNLYNNYYLSVA